MCPDCETKRCLGTLSGIVLNFPKAIQDQTIICLLEVASGKYRSVKVPTVKERKDFVSSLEVCRTHDAFSQLIGNSSFIILHSICICYTYVR